MGHRYLKVDPQLEEYVRTVLVCDGFSDTENPDLPLFVNGMPALFCRVEKSGHSIILYGKSALNEEWTVENRGCLIVFFFKPFALGTIFKLPASDLKKAPVELCLWNAQKAMALDVQLIHSGSVEEKISILGHFICTQIQANQKECSTIRSATDKMMLDPSVDVLSGLLEELGLTERTFQRIFKKYVGITPNEYRRICQFYFAFSQLKGRHFEKMADIVYGNGYFDQSHYIRSFKEFTDTTPNEYLQSGLGKKENE